jgi:hypothetical protein
MFKRNDARSPAPIDPDGGHEEIRAAPSEFLYSDILPAITR